MHKGKESPYPVWKNLLKQCLLTVGTEWKQLGCLRVLIWKDKVHQNKQIKYLGYKIPHIWTGEAHDLKSTKVNLGVEGQEIPNRVESSIGWYCIPGRGLSKPMWDYKKILSKPNSKDYNLKFKFIWNKQINKTRHRN